MEMMEYMNVFEKALKKAKNAEDKNNFILVNMLVTQCLKILALQKPGAIIDKHSVDEYVYFLLDEAAMYYERYYWGGYQTISHYPAEIIDVAEKVLLKELPFDEMLYMTVKLTKENIHK